MRQRIGSSLGDELHESVKMTLATKEYLHVSSDLF